jgi:hypothetical protein
MKKIHLFATKWWYFLVCLPPLFVFILCLIYHPRTTTKLGLFPLEFAMLGVIAFSIMFFVRTVRISFEEVRVTGIFSDHDHMDMVLGRQIILVQYPHNNLGIYVYGEDFAEEKFWLLNEKPKEHILMRARAVGGEKSMKRVLRYFGLNEEIAQAVLSDPKMSIYEGEYINVETLTVDERFVVRIFLKRQIEIEED